MPQAALEGSKTPESGLAWIPHRRDTVQPLIVTDAKEYAEPAVAQLDDLNVLLSIVCGPLRQPTHRDG